MSSHPNILIILCDDLGYSDLGCYGGEIETPHLDRLAGNGLRLTRFYNTPRCSPSRASLLTGLHPHQAGIGVLTDHKFEGDYAGKIHDRCVTIPEVLKPLGYKSYMSGKWHVTGSFQEPDGNWPTQRGFDHHYGILTSGSSFFNPRGLKRNFENVEHEAKEDDDYYITDALSDDAAACIDRHCQEHPDQPFFQYVAYTAPHSPMHAKEEDIEKYKGRYAEGWDVLRQRRYEQLKKLGIISEDTALSPRDPGVRPWEEVGLNPKVQAWQERRMEVYAAMVDNMDQGIGRILDALERNNQLENTLVMFLSDNGACAEDSGLVYRPDGSPRMDHPDIMPGPDSSWMHCGVGWANLQATPFRLYKHWTHEGGISTPCIIHWPEKIKNGGAISHEVAYLPDIMKTLIDITGATYPQHNAAGAPLHTLEGESMAPVLDGGTMPDRLMFWEHEGNAAVRDGKWKLVKNFSGNPSGWGGHHLPTRGDWELYDTVADPTELRNLASSEPERVQTMQQAWHAWADRCGVLDREWWLQKMTEAKVAVT